MLWYVNPYNADQAINLTRVMSLTKKDQNIQFDTKVWSFDSDKKSTEVYEHIIKLVQQTRYRLTMGVS